MNKVWKALLVCLVLSPPVLWSQTVDPCAPTQDVPSNPSYNPDDVVCPLHADAVAVATDADQITTWRMSEPVYLQYCNGDQCSAPIPLHDHLRVLHSNPLLRAGGLPVGMGQNVLYALQGNRDIHLTINSSGILVKKTVHYLGAPRALTIQP